MTYDTTATPASEAAPAPKILFKPASWTSKIDFINHLILFNNVLITVVSEKEGGKTSFGALLQNNLDQQVKSVSIAVNTPCDREELINSVAAQLHLNHNLETDVASIVAQVNERKAHVVLIIDDAQNLPEAFLKELIQALKNQGDFGFFHLCFIADYTLVATLNTLFGEPLGNLLHTIELGAMSESETRTYVLQSALAGRLGNKPISENQFKQFYQATKGNLSKINAGLESFLLQSNKPMKPNRLFTLQRVNMAISAVLISGMSYMYFNSVYLTNKFPEIAQITSLPPVEQLLDKVNTAQNVQNLESKIASWQDSSTVQFVEYALPKKQTLDLELEDQDQINTVAIVDKVLVIPTLKTKSLPASPPSTAPEPVQESQLVKVEGLVGQIIDKSGKANKYTIQLVASHNIADIHRFQQSHKLLTQTTVRHFTNAKGNWYILTLGEYQDRKSAQNEASKLPVDLARLGPWVRATSGLDNIA
ncbi:MAG: SPOR domain-containing protein [Legionella sp.]|nr:SPOR domain-containing protein [Legionella sp.]